MTNKKGNSAKTTALFLYLALTSVVLPTEFAYAEDKKSAITIYNKDYFSQFSPQSLKNMIENIPGTASLLNAINNNNNRGFGSAGDQILINGKRLSGKANGIGDELNRIQAKTVDRIELIRGTVAGLDVLSEGLIVNVILKDEVSSSTLFVLGAATAVTGNTRRYGNIYHSGSNGLLKYGANYKRFGNAMKRQVDEIYTDQNKELLQERHAVITNTFYNDEVNGNIDYQVSPQTSLRLNGMLRFRDYYSTRPKNIDFTALSGASSQHILEDSTTHNQDRLWEFGGDIEHKIDDNSSMKLLFITSDRDADDLYWQDKSKEGGALYKNYQLPRTFTVKEHILRPTFKTRLNSKHALEFGGEIAINTRDEDLQYQSLSGITYHSTELNDIKETRKEAFISHNFSISDKLNLQSSLNGEWSTIDVDTVYTLVTKDTQGASSSPSNSFSNLKPRINLRYDMSINNQFRFNAERTVSQLYLGDFVPKFNTDQNRLEPANPDLKPEIRDEFSATFEHKLDNDNGNIALTSYYHDISDYLTEIPLAQWSGTGNIDKAKEYGIKVDGSLRLSILGLENTVISGYITVRDGDAINPFTGKLQHFDHLSEDSWSASVKHNEPELGLYFNFSLSQQTAHGQFNRYDYTATNNNDVKASAFVEYQLASNMKLRLEGKNLLHRKSDRQLTRHLGLYTNTEISQYETRNITRERQFYLQLTSQF